jgi:hypothetical protein
MNREDARRLLDRIGVLRHPCDLDLLMFFARHPRTLLSSDSLASFLGCELKQLAESLELLLEAGLLTRTQTTAHAARLYVLAADSGGDAWFPALLALASTRPGRLALRETLARRSRPRGEDAALRPVVLSMKAKPGRKAKTG